MPTARVNGVTLYYEETGSGFPLIWCHADMRALDAQVAREPGLVLGGGLRQHVQEIARVAKDEASGQPARR